jgi:ribosomal protein S17E
MCIKDLNIIFDTELEQEKLYTKSNLNTKSTLSFTAATHGLMYLTEKDAQFIYDNTDIIPFNAGQYLFLNTYRMQQHFKNIIWLSSIWPGLYFFEQSFMNHYFALNGLVEQRFLFEKVDIIFSQTSSSPIPRKEILREKNPNIIKKNLIVRGATNSLYTPFEPEITDNVEESKQVITTYMDMTKKHTDATILLHFAGFTLNGKQKIDYINKYSNAYQLPI